MELEEENRRLKKQVERLETIVRTYQDGLAYMQAAVNPNIELYNALAKKE